jgi:hypothetical protein
MIVVVEGPSAAGKSTWCIAHGSDNVIAETDRVELPAVSSDHELARFWSDINCGRWAQAVRVENQRGLAVCDTDPLKLHYDYCLARIGSASWERFEAGAAVAAEAIASHQLGVADIMLVNISDDETLTRQRNSDTTRRRRDFDLHRLLGPGLRDWYETLDRLDPGRVSWQYPTGLPPTVARDRYNTDLFGKWMEQLPRYPTSTW